MSLRKHAIRILEESFSPEVITERQISAEMERIAVLPLKEKPGSFSYAPLTIEEFQQFMRRCQ